MRASTTDYIVHLRDTKREDKKSLLTGIHEAAHETKASKHYGIAVSAKTEEFATGGECEYRHA